MPPVDMPPDPFLPDGQFLKSQAFHALRFARDQLAAAQTLGLDTERYHEQVAALAALNEHFNPADVRRMQHGQPATG